MHWKKANVVAYLIFQAERKWLMVIGVVFGE